MEAREGAELVGERAQWRQAARRGWITLAEQWGGRSWRRAVALGRPPLELRALLAGASGAGRASRWLESAAMHGAATAGQAWLADATALSAPLERLRRAGGAPLLVVGDSHSHLHLRSGRRGGRFLTPAGAIVSGASARGLGATGSRSGNGARILSALEATARSWKTPPAVLFVFGQVDVEFVHVFKRIEAGADDDDESAFEVFAAETVERYAGWLGEAAQRWPARIAVSPIFPPALSDATWAQGYLNAHLAGLHGSLAPDRLAERLLRFTSASLAIRSDRHRRFNAKLRRALVGSRIFMPPDFAELETDGVIDPCFLGGAAGRDHHLDYVAVRTPTLSRLWSVLEAAPGS